ncbi:LysR family transcriptional regulator [Amycolatopsis sp. DG1A-15b]|uniref:LysR family transcriptional regulator n=1 Tax=Amycolatopsis sp. DG1A-15b TaxID=3052846 RepID=UPI00255B85A6|nr:LysR family transcriptional regulator [Amycolatopsis sp. DG1A-15b]WIX90297.1 LysR family transcriptional regulator [Amycolatopsis sp. DG1A-15b]
MELRALRYFVTVADELHFGRAADRLHIAQPAVSRQIARLERELGVRLFDRSPRQVRLTVAGLRVLDAARAALAAADRVRVAASPQAGVMRIGTGTGQFAARLERGIDALREQAPAFDVVLVDLPLPARLNALRQGELDLALARGVRAAPGLRVLPAWTEALFAVVSVRHAVAGHAAVGVAELAGGPFRTAQDHDPSVVTALREAGAPVRPGHRAGTAGDTIIEVGSDPRSWTVLPADQVAELRSTRVRAIPLEPRTTITGSVVIPDDLPSPCTSAHRAAFGD